MRLDRSGLYRECKARQVRILKESAEEHPQWYACVFHEVTADQPIPIQCDRGAMG